MRKRIVAGNWKMNHSADKAYELADRLEQYGIDNPLAADKEVILAPPFIYLESLVGKLQLLGSMKVAAQNCHQAANGAYTGEVAAPMLKSIGVDCVIIGHSERRAYFRESNDLLREKVDAVLESDLQPIFCCGESLEERDAGSHKDFVSGQLEASLFHLGADAISRCIIAYEPIWAIGTGRTATPEQAQDMHSFIRFLLDGKYGKMIADDMTILYGGSCKPSNAAEIFGQPDVDGGLIGGASLKAEDFTAIIEAL
jgi:triosephosphate isomerase